MLSSILMPYGIHDFTATTIASGLINRTWKVSSRDKEYILQRVNHNVFKKPFEVGENIRRIDEYLKRESPQYLFIAPILNNHQQEVTEVKGDGYYRLFPFVKGSHTINVVTSADQAYEASHQFGKFTRLLSGFDAGSLHITIPDFHNLTLRYKQFEKAIAEGNDRRIKESNDAIKDIQNHVSILETFINIQRNGQVKRRVTHHDTKISNVLFNDHGKGICVIDLDTVMPGYFISDVGDMMRTYLSPANEEIKDMSQIVIREEFFKAIVQGYLGTMQDELTSEERDLFYYAGTFLIYMQAMRFLTDHCNDDIYYGSSYEGHNLVRAINQLTLLKMLEEKKSLLNEIVATELRERKYFRSLN